MELKVKKSFYDFNEKTKNKIFYWFNDYTIIPIQFKFKQIEQNTFVTLYVYYVSTMYIINMKQSIFPSVLWFSNGYFVYCLKH